VTRESVAAMADAFAKDLIRENIAADRMIAEAEEFIAPIEKISYEVFSRWAAPIQGMS
jgi:hypothetical protein